MLTLFSIPKAFQGHTGIIQRNAIKSWTLMRPRPEIILFGDDEGTAEVAKSFGLRHVAQVARNEYGTPLLNDLFEQAQQAAAHDVLCYVNADVILMSDFFQAVDQVVRWKTCFLLVGQRWDIDIREPLDFPLRGWTTLFSLDECGVIFLLSPLDELLGIIGLFIGHVPGGFRWLMPRTH